MLSKAPGFLSDQKHTEPSLTHQPSRQSLVAASGNRSMFESTSTLEWDSDDMLNIRQPISDTSPLLFQKTEKMVLKDLVHGILIIHS